MAIPKSVQQLNKDKFIESTASAGEVAVKVVNPDGSNISAGGGGTTTVEQTTHDDLNANANIQVGDADAAKANPVPMADATTSISQGAKTVTTAGTAEAIVASSTPAKFILVTANSGNTGVVAIGGSGILAASNGGKLKAEQTVMLPVPDWDLQNMYLDVSTNGDGITFTYWN